MQFSIAIDHDAREWIVKKGAVLTIERLKAGRCWVGQPLELITRFGEPKEKERFVYEHKDGIAIFIEKGIDFKDNHLSITLSGFSIFKGIYVHGLKRFWREVIVDGERRKDTNFCSTVNE